MCAAANNIEHHEKIENSDLFSSFIFIFPYLETANINKKINNAKLPNINEYSNFCDKYEYKLDSICELKTGSIKTKIDNNKDNKIVILITNIFQLGSKLFLNV